MDVITCPWRFDQSRLGKGTPWGIIGKIYNVPWYHYAIYRIIHIWPLNVLINSLRPTHICVCKFTIIGSDKGLSLSRRQAIIWTNAGILFIRLLETNFIEILIEIHISSFKKMHLKMLSAKCRTFCLGLIVLTHRPIGDVSVILNVQFSNVIQSLIYWTFPVELSSGDAAWRYWS